MPRGVFRVREQHQCQAKFVVVLSQRNNVVNDRTAPHYQLPSLSLLYLFFISVPRTDQLPTVSVPVVPVPIPVPVSDTYVPCSMFHVQPEKISSPWTICFTAIEMWYSFHVNFNNVDVGYFVLLFILNSAMAFFPLLLFLLHKCAAL